MKRKEEKNITINDIAKACGVSKTTVSRYLNGKDDCFSEETGDKISKAIAELGYSPNRSAQRLKANSTKLIGCSIGDMSRPFAGLLLRGITGVFQDTDYQVLFTHCDNDPVKERNAIEGFLANRVDGLIVNTSGRNDEYLISVAKRGIPLVLADRGLLGERKLDTVELDNEEVAYECIRMLCNYGYEKIAFFTEELGSISPRISRHKGFCRAIEDFYPGNIPHIYEIHDGSNDAWIAAIEEFRNANPGKRIAALTSNGVATYNMVLAYNEMGHSFGYEFGLLSFDDWDLMKVTQPGITSVSIPTEEIGATSAKLLLEQIAKNRGKERVPVLIKVEGQLNIRGSTINEKK